jgi:hypothetical protein
MTKKAEDKKLDALDPLFVLGLEGGKPRGARFAECTDIAVRAAMAMGLNCVHPASEAFAELALKLPKGRVYASGKAFVPNIRRDLYDKLVAMTEMPGDGSQVHKARPASVDGSREERSRVACISPVAPGLPKSWDSVGIGHMVLIHESPADGWWEAVVLQREDEVLTLRFRDYPKQPTFVRHISAIALVNPGPADPQPTAV